MRLIYETGKAPIAQIISTQVFNKNSQLEKQYFIRKITTNITFFRLSQKHKLTLKSIGGLRHRIFLDHVKSGPTYFASILPAICHSQENFLLHLVQHYVLCFEDSENHSKEYLLC
jgi:hypothetical protein